MSIFTPLAPRGLRHAGRGVDQFLFGKKEKMQQIPRFTPEQQSLLNNILGQLQGQNTNITQNPLYQGGSSYLQELLSGSPESTAAFEAPYKRQFNEEIVPGLAERFSGAGAGSQRSSAFQNALGQAGAGLSERLASLREGLRSGASQQALGYAQQPISNFSGLAGLGLTPSFESFLRPQTGGFLGGLFGGAAQGAGQAGGSALMAKLLPLLGLL
jgi:hypothetical protein